MRVLTIRPLISNLTSPAANCSSRKKAEHQKLPQTSPQTHSAFNSSGLRKSSATEKLTRLRSSRHNLRQNKRAEKSALFYYPCRASQAILNAFLISPT